MSAEEIAFEAVKLALQFGGALFIAWRAVQWALSRYKSEKIWERRLAAYTDLLAALARMNQALGIWELEALRVPVNLSDSDRADVLRRYNEARRAVEETWGAAQLILPDDVAKLLASFATDIDNARHKGRHDQMIAIGEEWAVLERARHVILKLGRADLAN